MSSGFTRDGNVQKQIDDTIADAVKKVLAAAPVGTSPAFCKDCGSTIPLKRRTALPGTRLCVFCALDRENLKVATGGLNRRAPPDSQLR